MECEPGVSVDVENVALLPEMVEVPMMVAPSKNWTVPVPPGDGVAVKVIPVASQEGFALDTSVVVVGVCPKA